MKYYYGIGLYSGMRVMDDFGNLIALTDDQFDAVIYYHLGMVF